MPKWTTSTNNSKPELMKSIPLSNNPWKNSRVLPPLTHPSVLKVLTPTSLYTLIPTPYIMNPVFRELM
jgi:hypothetical protein